MNLLEILRLIRNGEYKKYHTGICHIVYNLASEEELDEFQRIYVGWPLYSGDINSPVWEEGIGLSPINQYIELPHWEGKQLELRLNLLDYCISVLEEEQT